MKFAEYYKGSFTYKGEEYNTGDSITCEIDINASEVPENESQLTIINDAKILIPGNQRNANHIKLWICQDDMSGDTAAELLGYDGSWVCHYDVRNERFSDGVYKMKKILTKKMLNFVDLAFPKSPEKRKNSILDDLIKELS